MRLALASSTPTTDSMTREPVCKVIYVKPSESVHADPRADSVMCANSSRRDLHSYRPSDMCALEEQKKASSGVW